MECKRRLVNIVRKEKEVTTKYPVQEQLHFKKQQAKLASKIAQSATTNLHIKIILVPI